MKILKFYLTNGYIQAVDIETVVPAGNSYIDRPRVQSIRLEKHGECRGSYRGNPWTYSKYLSSMGIAMNNWINLASDRDLYQYWEEYQEFCCSNHTPVVDDLLESIMDCPVYCEENFVKMIYNTCRDADFSLDDYVHAKRQSGELEARFVACL